MCWLIYVVTGVLLEIRCFAVSVPFSSNIAGLAEAFHKEASDGSPKLSSH